MKMESLWTPPLPKCALNSTLKRDCKNCSWSVTLLSRKRLRSKLSFWSQAMVRAWYWPLIRWWAEICPPAWMYTRIIMDAIRMPSTILKTTCYPMWVEEVWFLHQLIKKEAELHILLVCKWEIQQTNRKEREVVIKFRHLWLKEISSSNKRRQVHLLTDRNMSCSCPKTCMEPMAIETCLSISAWPILLCTHISTLRMKSSRRRTRYRDSCT